MSARCALLQGHFPAAFVHRFPGGARDPRAALGDPPSAAGTGCFSVQPPASWSFRKVAGNGTRVACSTRNLVSRAHAESP